MQLLQDLIDQLGDMFGGLGNFVMSTFFFWIEDLQDFAVGFVMGLVENHLPPAIPAATETALQWLAIANAWVPLDLLLTFFKLGIAWWIALIPVRLGVALVRR